MSHDESEKWNRERCDVPVLTEAELNLSGASGAEDAFDLNSAQKNINTQMWNNVRSFESNTKSDNNHISVKGKV